MNIQCNICIKKTILKSLQFVMVHLDNVIKCIETVSWRTQNPFRLQMTTAFGYVVLIGLSSAVDTLFPQVDQILENNKITP